MEDALPVYPLSSSLSHDAITLKKKEVTWEGKWVRSLQLEYGTSTTSRSWDSFERTTRTSDIDCVEVITTLNEHDTSLSSINQREQVHRIVLVIQYRPPVDKYCIEFPAGLVDVNESAEAAAVRECKEETGYSGRHQHTSPIVYHEVGITNANGRVVHLDVDMHDPINHNVMPELDGTETLRGLRMITVKLKNLLSSLQELERRGYALDSKVYAFAYGMEIANKYSQERE